MTFEDTKFKLTHLPQLDGIRGIAIILVILFHSSYLHLPGGFIGVDIFFVLSGFLITSLLVQEFQRNRKINLKNFFIRRVLRLQPAVIILLLSLIFASFVLKDRFATTPEMMLKVSLFTLTNVANWALILGWSAWPAALTHIWSLAIEEQFYLIWPFILSLFLSQRIKFWWILSFLIVISNISIFFQAFLWFNEAPFERRYFATDARVFGLLIGCISSLLIIKYGLPNKFISSILTVIGLFSLATFAYNTTNNSSFMYYGGFTLVSIFSSFLIIGSINSFAYLKKVLSIKLLRKLGEISYGLYLWHGVIFYFFDKVTFLELSPFLENLLAISASTLVSLISYSFIEKKALRLKSRFTSIK